MTAIEKIINEIKDNGYRYADELKQNKMQQIEASFEIEKEAIILDEKRELETRQRQLKSTVSQKRKRQQLDLKQKLLNKKQAYLEQLFLEVVDQMNHWPSDYFQKFVEQIILQLPLKGSINVQLGSFSKDKIDQEWFEQYADQEKDFFLCDDLISDEGGLLFSKNGIDYNCLFSKLIEEIKKSESFAVAEKLFQSED